MYLAAKYSAANIIWIRLKHRLLWNSMRFSAIKSGPDDQQSGMQPCFATNYTIIYLIYHYKSKINK